MPYLIIQCRGVFGIEKGPTVVGDIYFMDSQIEQLLECTRKNSIFGPPQCITKYPPRVVMDKLAQLGYALVASSCAGTENPQNSWTLYKP